MVVYDKINVQDSSINKKSNNTMSVMLCTGATFVKENSCLVARVVSFDTPDLHLLAGEWGGGVGGRAGPPITGIPFVNLPNSRLPNQ